MSTHPNFAAIHELVVDRIDNTDVREHLAGCDLCGTLALSIAPDDAGGRAAAEGLVAVDPSTYVDKRPLASGGMGRTFTARDRRLGLCIDIGHTGRTGTDIVPAAAHAGDRVLDLHIKDLRDLSDARSQCIVGEGAIPIAAGTRTIRPGRRSRVPVMDPRVTPAIRLPSTSVFDA